MQLNSSLVIGLASVCVGTATSFSLAQSVRQFAITDQTGYRVVSATSDEGESGHGVFRGDGVVWHLNDAISITNSVAIADTAGDTWLGHNLNSERIGYHETTGDGTEIFFHDLVPEDAGTVSVSCAEDVSLGVVCAGLSKGVVVRAFSATGGNTPLWNYSFPGGYTVTGYRGVDVSDDGSLVIAYGYNAGTTTSYVALLDGATGAELDSRTTGFLLGVEISGDGSRAMLTESATAHVIDTTTMNDIFSFAASGGGGWHRLSRDGCTAAAGGFNFLAYREDGLGNWNLAYSTTESGEWLGNGIGLSADGCWAIVSSHNYAGGYLDTTHRMIDLVNGVETARVAVKGSGTFQDSMQVAQSDELGNLFVVASWGLQNNEHPEVQFFDRDLTLVASLDTPGSPWHVDMTRDGRYTVVGGKAVHANTFGNGSDSYVYEVAPPDCPADWNQDGQVLTDDFLAYLNDYVAVLNGGAPTYGDPDLAVPFGVLNTSDFIAFLNLFTGGCT